MLLTCLDTANAPLTAHQIKETRCIIRSDPETFPVLKAYITLGVTMLNGQTDPVQRIKPLQLASILPVNGKQLGMDAPDPVVSDEKISKVVKQGSTIHIHGVLIW